MTIRPKIIISSLDAIRLEKLLESLPDSVFPGKDDLEVELARAEVVDPKEIPSYLRLWEVRCWVFPKVTKLSGRNLVVACCKCASKKSLINQNALVSICAK